MKIVKVFKEGRKLITLEFQSLMVTLRTTSFNIKKSYLVLTWHLCGSQKKTGSFPLWGQYKIEMSSGRGL
jgi:hypothetical protein